MGIVHRDWAQYNNEEDEWKVFYAPPRDYNILEDHVKEGREPKPYWRLYRCKSIKQAATYEQAVRRLDRAVEKASSDIESSPIEAGSGIGGEPEDGHIFPNVIVLGNDELERELDFIAVNSDAHQEYGCRNKRRNTEERNDLVARKKSKNAEDMDSFRTPPLNGKQSTEEQRSTSSSISPSEESPSRSSPGAMYGASIHDKRDRILFDALFKALESFKRSSMYDFQKKFTQLTNHLNTSMQRFCISTTEAMETLAITLPFNTVEELNAFDEILRDSSEKKKILQSVMATRCTGSTSLKESFTATLSGLLSKKLQLEDSACGKETRGHKKLSFKDTSIYGCLEAVLIERHSVSATLIISKMSRWFTGAIDRSGNGRRRTAPRPRQ
ncbi:uncharacterized protein LOC135160786 isoform X2 [Diachasmimorpha longicaudata]